MNSGNSAAYDVPLKGTVDDVLIEEIPEVQDFAANISKTYTIKRTADTTANEIHLWANIGVPEGFIDGNLSNNIATLKAPLTYCPIVHWNFSRARTGSRKIIYPLLAFTNRNRTLRKALHLLP